MRDIEGFQSPRSEGLSRALREWIKCNEDYCCALDWRDAAWWYNERASLSTFSAAVWRAGGIALEEFSTKKLCRRGHRNGRCDLYLQFPDERFSVEAKFIWSNLGQTLKTQMKRIEDKLDLACQDAIRTDEGGRKLGMVCVSAYLPATYDDGKVNGQIEEWIDQLREVSVFARSWSFPGRMRAWKPTDPQGRSHRYFPGCALVFRKA